VNGRTVRALRRIGKRIAIGFDNDTWLVLHLMIAGRLHWVTKKVKPDGRRTLAAFRIRCRNADADGSRIAKTGVAARRRGRCGTRGARPWRDRRVVGNALRIRGSI
jgi:formamidopyrimidine-DNA glycosylase